MPVDWEVASESPIDQSPKPKPRVEIPEYAPGQPEHVQLAYQNNNPGNLEYAGQPGAEKNGRWAKFPDADTGYGALKQQIKIDADRGLSVGDYIKKFAPASENDTETYIRNATKALGVDRSRKLSDIDHEKMAAFQSAQESSSKVAPDNHWEVASEEALPPVPKAPLPAGLQQQSAAAPQVAPTPQPPVVAPQPQVAPQPAAVQQPAAAAPVQPVAPAVQPDSAVPPSYLERARRFLGNATWSSPAGDTSHPVVPPGQQPGFMPSDVVGPNHPKIGAALDMPLQGGQQFFAGAKEMENAKTWTERAGAAANILGGYFGMAAAELPEAVVVAPVKTALALGLGTVGQKTAEKMLGMLDAPEQWQRLGGEVGALLGGVIGARGVDVVKDGLTRKMLRDILQDKVNEEFRVKQRAENREQAAANAPKQLTEGKGEPAPPKPPEDIQEAEFEDVTPKPKAPSGAAAEWEVADEKPIEPVREPTEKAAAEAPKPGTSVEPTKEVRTKALETPYPDLTPDEHDEVIQRMKAPKWQPEWDNDPLAQKSYGQLEMFGKEHPALEEQPAESAPKTEAPSTIGTLLAGAKRKYKVGGEPMEEADPRAQIILKSLKPEDLKQVDALMAGSKNPSVMAAGFDHVVVDLGNDKVMRLGQLPKHEAESEYIAKPSVSKAVGDVGVEIYPKLETKGITDADVQSVKDALAEKGLTWGDAATDNLARDAKGDLKIIDGNVEKAPSSQGEKWEVAKQAEVVKEAEAPKHDYSSTQLNAPEHITSAIRKFTDKLPSDKLAEDGVEAESHVTALYGLHDESPDAVREALKGVGPITVKIGPMSIFPANEGQEARGGAQYDVLKLDIDSPQLHALNAKLKELPHTSTFPKYVPHLTLGYLVPGKGKKYAGRPLPNVTGKTITLDKVVFSSKNGEKTEIPLKAEAKAGGTTPQDAFRMGGKQLAKLAEGGDAGAKAEIERRAGKGKAPLTARGAKKSLGEIDQELTSQARDKATREHNDHILSVLKGINSMRMTPAERSLINDYLGLGEGATATVTKGKVQIEQPEAESKEPAKPNAHLDSKVLFNDRDRVEARQRRAEDAINNRRTEDAKKEIAGLQEAIETGEKHLTEYADAPDTYHKNLKAEIYHAKAFITRFEYPGGSQVAWTDGEGNEHSGRVNSSSPTELRVRDSKTHEWIYVPVTTTDLRHSGKAAAKVVDIVNPEATGAAGLSNAVYKKLSAGESLGNVTELNKLAEKYFGSSRTSGEWTPKDAFDAMEVGINRHLLDIGKGLMEKPAEEGLKDLRKLMERVTSQGVRTAEQDKFQQFSTPPTESYVVAKVADLKPTDVVLEPSGGNGGLAVWPKSIGAEVHVNEISDRRREMLELAGFGKATAHDGEIINALMDPAIRPTVILMNPPFSAGGAKAGVARNNNQYGFNHVDSALQRLAPGGRLVAILGGGRADDANGGATLLGGPSGAWFKGLAKRYNVRANIRVHGKEYQKYGTAFATRIIVIDKDGPTPSQMEARPSWESVVRGNADTLEEAYNLLRDVADSRPVVEAPGAEGEGRAGETQPATAQGGTAGRGRRGTPRPVAGRAGTVGPEPGAVQPGRSTGDVEGQRAGGVGELPGGGESGLQPEGSPEETAARNPEGAAGNAPRALTRQELIDAAKKKFAESRGEAPPKNITRSHNAESAARRAGLTLSNTPIAPPEKASTPADAAKKAAEEAAARMRARMGKRGDEPIRFSRSDGGELVPRDIDPDDLIDLATIGAGHIVDGATTYPKWVEQMSAAAGDMVEFAAQNASLPVDDVLRQVYDLASAVAEDYGAKAEPAPPAIPREVQDKALTGDEENIPLDLQKSMEHESDIEDSSAYIQYKPSIQGPKHPGSIVETKTMGTVPLPAITYSPDLPKSVMDKGTISAVQLEAIALAGQANSTILPDGSRAMLLVGDSTGLGKGREAAGILWDNFRQGRKRLVWMSQNWDLMQDAMRDLEGIGAKEMLRGNERDAKGQFKTSSTSFVQPASRFKYGEPIKHQGVLYATHALARGKDKKGNTRERQLEDYLRGDDNGEGAVFIIDEAHNLKNAVAAGRAKPSQQGAAVRRIIQAIPGLRVTALSATAATDVINLGWMDRLGLWGAGTAFPNGFNEFAGQIASGRLAAMEMIATELKAQGKYLSRTLSFKGVKYSEEEHKITPDQKAIYRTAAKAWKTVFEAASKTIATTTNGGSTQKANFNQAAGGALQRFFGFLITALKTPTAVELANKALAEGKSVVITMVNTGEAAQKREKNRVAAARADSGDEDDEDEIFDYDFGPKQMLIDLVRQNYPVQQYADDVDDNGNPIKVPVFRLDEDGREIPVNNPEAEVERDALIADIDRDLHLPENPLDILINSLGGGTKVAELTGRGERFDVATGKFVPRGDPNVARKNINISEMRNLQTGKKRVAVLTGAANAGISLHSSLDSPNQQPRYHITLQAGWSADKAMQMMGRTHRTNQAHPPEYVMLISDLGGEKRFIATISRRLGSLGALTKGQKNATSGTDLMDKVNFETVEGRAAATAFYEQLLRNEQIPGTGLTGLQVLQDMRMLTGPPPTVRPTDRPNVTKLLNRLMALDPDIQNAAYNYYYDIFQATVQRAIDAGTLDTGVETLPGDEFSIKGQRTIARDPKTGAQTIYYPVDAKIRNDRVSPKDLAKRMRDHADENPRILVNKDGKLALVIDADPIVHASGSIEQALYSSTPARGKWTKVPKNQTEYKFKEAEEWGKEALETAQRELEPAQYRVDSAQREVSSPYGGTWAQGRLKSAEEALAAAQAAVELAMPAADNPAKWAKDQWEKQYDDAPSHSTEEHHLIGRAVMNYWNAISDASHFSNIYTTTDSKTGQRVVGVDIPAESIRQLLSRIEGGGSTVNAHQLIADVLRNGLTYTLEGGIQVRRTRIGRLPVIQMTPPSPDVAQNLLGLGLIHERGVTPVYYIPSAAHMQEAIVGRVLDQYPVQQDTTPPDEPIRESRPVPGFYSQSERTIEAKMPAKATADQVLGILRNPTNSVKPDEIKWSGIEQWLADQKGPVSKQEVLDFLKLNGTVGHIREEPYGEPDTKAIDARIRELSTDRSADGLRTARHPEDQRELDRLTVEWNSLNNQSPPAKYAQYSIPGGENNREIVIALPVHGVPDIEWGRGEIVERNFSANGGPSWVETKEWTSKDGDATITFQPGRGYVGNSVRVQNAGLGNPYNDTLDSLLELPAAVSQKFQQLTNDDAKRSGTNAYKSPHYEGIPNYALHIRLADHTTADGKRVTLLNEVQSDRGQEGRKKGYKQEVQLTPEEKELQALNGKTWTNEELTPEERARQQELQRTVGNSLVHRITAAKNGVPNFPFAKNWAEVGFKRGLRDAVENGSDLFGWTTGDTQADRYDLSKQVDWVEWTGDTLTAGRGDRTSEDTENLMQERIQESKLPDYVGKEVADKLIQRLAEGKGTAVVEGEDLKVGAPGMKGFYDKILVDYANRYLKKWGVKVGTTEVSGPAPNHFSVVYTNGIDPEDGFSVHEGGEVEHVANFKTEKEAEEHIKSLGDKIKIHSVPITPPMRASVMQGQPLFMKGAETPQPGPVKARFRNGVLWVNSAGMRQIAEHIGVTGTPNGMYVPPKLAETLVDLGGNWKAGDSVTVVRMNTGDSVSQAKARARHELFHATEEWSDNGRRGRELLKDPLAQKAKAGLVRNGYSPNDAMIFSEIGAHLASGPLGWSDMGLTSDEARDLFKQHAKLLPDEVVAKLNKIAPQLKQELYAEQAIRKSAFSLEQGNRGELPEAAPSRGAGPLRRSVGQDVPEERKPAGREYAGLTPGKIAERGSAPVLSDIAQWMKDQYGEMQDQVNYSGLGALGDVFNRNLSQLSKANEKADAAAIKLGSYRSRAATILHAATGPMEAALKGSDITLPELRLAMIQDRLDGIRNRWENFRDQSEVSSDEDLERGYTEQYADLLDAIEGRGGMPSDLSNIAAGLVENKEWDALRKFLQDAFDKAASRVAQPMDRDWFDFVSQHPQVLDAINIYRAGPEAAMADAHSVHEGVFSTALGDRFGVYYPLIPIDREPKQGYGRRLPFHKPKNMNNMFATGLASGYDATQQAFRKRLESAIHASDKFDYLKVLEDEGWFEPAKKNQTTFIQPNDGREVQGRLVEMNPVKLILKPGQKPVRVPARMGIMPEWLYQESAPLLEGKEFGPRNLVTKIVNAINTFAVMGVAEPIFHGRNILGAMIQASPFIGKALAQKGMKPFLKDWDAAIEALNLRPSPEEISKDLIEMAKYGIVPDRFGAVSYSKAAAEQMGGKQTKFGLSPLLFGTNGLDIKARWLLYRVQKQLNPDATAREINLFVNQLGNYVHPLQGRVERFLKGIGLSPFYTAGSAGIKRGIKTWTSIGPNPTQSWRDRLLHQLLVGGLVGTVLWALVYKHMTGRLPQKDRAARFGYVPIPPEFRHTAVGNSLWGPGSKRGEVNLLFWNPDFSRGARLFGIPKGFENSTMGGNQEQIEEGAFVEMLNSFAQPVMGPVPRAALAGSLGIESYMTGARDDTGRVAPQFYRALPKKTGDYPFLGTHLKGSAANAAWRLSAAAKETNSFYHDVGQATGLFPKNPDEKDDNWQRSAINLALPGVFSSPRNPTASADYLRRQRAGMR